MKKLAIFSALILINFSVIAQSHHIGLKYISSPQSDDFSDVSYLYRYNSNNGYTGIGISYDFYSKSNFTIGTEATFNNFRDYSHTYFGVQEGNVDYKRQFHFVSVPIKLGYKVNIGKKLFLHPSVGIISSYLTNVGTNLNNRYFDSVKSYKRFDVLGLVDIAAGINLNENIALTGSYRYQFRPKELEQGQFAPGPISTNRGNFTIGLNFKLPSKR